MSFHPARTASAALLAMGAAVTAFGVSNPADQIRAQAERGVVIERVAVPTARADAPAPFSITVQIAEGDTLESVLAASEVHDPAFITFANSNDDTAALASLQVGRILHLDVDGMGRVLELRYSLGIDDGSSRTGLARRLVVRRGTDGLESDISSVELARNTQVGVAVIESSLFAATGKAGIPYAVANQVADVFGNDIRFERDLRPGDRLKVIYETLREPDSYEPPEPGRLIAAEFVNRGRLHTAIWVPTDNTSGQYYDFEGRSAASAFLRYPIEFARISSGFQQARLHPVLGTRQAHNGTDFAAQPGTPIRATGDGVVEWLGEQRGYGRTIVLRHGSKYSTLYAHMRGYRKGLRDGSVVRQGDVIGYVGSSGWATGPHVHYEFRLNDRPLNPLSTKLPQANPLLASQKAYHAERVAQLRTQFAQLNDVQLAASFR